MLDDIKCRYALDSLSEKIIDVKNLEKEDRKGVYTCLDCKGIVTPIMGVTMQKHFRHLNLNSSCSRETYLHAFAKRKFYEIYNKCLEENLEFYIEYNIHRTCTRYKMNHLISCELSRSTIKFDLTKYFTKIQLEKEDESFRPDLLLTSENNGEKIYIEIVVTHKSTADKIASGHRIIEIFINDETDISSLENRIIRENSKRYFHNFLKRKFEGNFCQTKRYCSFLPYSSSPVPYVFFIIYKDRTSILERITFDEFDQKSKNISYWEFVCLPQKIFESFTTDKKNKIYLEIVAKLFKKGLTIDNCSLCRQYKAIDRVNTEDDIYCNLLRKNFNSNQAAICCYYNSNLTKIGSLVRYVGGMIKYRGKVGTIVSISGKFCKCKFNNKLTESLSFDEIKLIGKDVL
jgi:hypothetical protein